MKKDVLINALRFHNKKKKIVRGGGMVVKSYDKLSYKEGHTTDINDDGSEKVVTGSFLVDKDEDDGLYIDPISHHPIKQGDVYILNEVPYDINYLVKYIIEARTKLVVPGTGKDMKNDDIRDIYSKYEGEASIKMALLAKANSLEERGTEQRTEEDLHDDTFRTTPRRMTDDGFVGIRNKIAVCMQNIDPNQDYSLPFDASKYIHMANNIILCFKLADDANELVSCDNTTPRNDLTNNPRKKDYRHSRGQIILYRVISGNLDLTSYQGAPLLKVAPQSGLRSDVFYTMPQIIPAGISNDIYNRIKDYRYKVDYNENMKPIGIICLSNARTNRNNGAVSQRAIIPRNCLRLLHVRETLRMVQRELKLIHGHL